MPQQESGITVEIKNQHPVELVDLTRSLLAFADEYKRHVERSTDPLLEQEIKLYVKEIRPGSIIADLVAKAPYALPLIQEANHVIEFVKYLKECYCFLLGEKGDKPQLERINYENLSQIVEPVAKDNAAQINIGTLNINAETVKITLSSMESNAAQNAARREIDALKEPQTGIREKALLYWYQARNDPKSKTGDKAIIESIHNGPVKTIFVNESIKAKILSSSSNPFTMAYVVDVAVETIKGKPALYRILDMHETIERE